MPRANRYAGGKYARSPSGKYIVLSPGQTKCCTCNGPPCCVTDCPHYIGFSGTYQSYYDAEGNPVGDPYEGDAVVAPGGDPEFGPWAIATFEFRGELWGHTWINCPDWEWYDSLYGDEYRFGKYSGWTQSFIGGVWTPSAEDVFVPDILSWENAIPGSGFPASGWYGLVDYIDAECLVGVTHEWTSTGSYGGEFTTTINFFSRGFNEETDPDDDEDGIKNYIADPAFCDDCTNDCTSGPSTVTLTISAAAFGGNPAINESATLTKTSSNPCGYNGEFTAISGPNVGNVVTLQISGSGSAQLQLTAIDDTYGVLLFAAWANCRNHAMTITNAEFKVDPTSTGAGDYDPYTNIAVDIS